VEEWQMTNDLAALDAVFERAKRVLVGGGIVALVREQRSGNGYLRLLFLSNSSGMGCLAMKARASSFFRMTKGSLL
jgi:fructose-1,6-bisphosphatase